MDVGGTAVTHPPRWAALVALPVLDEAQGCDLRIDTGDLRVWTSRMGLEDGEPYARTVYVEALRDHRWLDVGHYDGDHPPRSLPVPVAFPT